MNVNLLHNGDMTAAATLETNETDSCCVPSAADSVAVGVAGL